MASLPPFLEETKVAACVVDSGSISDQDALAMYKRHLILVVRGAAKAPGGGRVEQPPSKKGAAAAGGRWWGGVELAALYEEGQESLSETFCVESGKDARGQSKVDAAHLLKQGAGGNQWYASFILQKDKELFEKTIKDLPVQQPSFLPGSHQSDALWFFFGRNTAGTDMMGRPEHTDQITHSGTWHLQVSGNKTWTLRPNASADGWKAAGGAPELDGGLRVLIEPGDVIVINTNCWFHSTSIPDTSKACDTLSFSYARDFFLGGGSARPFRECDMTNVEGTWARHEIKEGTVILREPPEACVQAAGNRSAFLACYSCCRPILSPGQHASSLKLKMSKTHMLEAGVPPSLEGLPEMSEGDAVPDPMFGASGTLVKSQEGEVFCSDACRERGTAVGVARLDAMHPLCKFVVHVLKAGHYQTFMIAAEIIARAVATEETDVEEVLSPYVAMGARAPGGGGSWHEMVGRDEGGEGGGGDDEVTIFKERDESFGMTVTEAMEVEAVEEGGAAARAGVQVGDKVLSIAGAELEEGAFEYAAKEMEGQSGVLADETMHRGFSTGWVGIELELKRGKKRKGTDAGGAGGGGAGGALKDVLDEGWRLLVAGLELNGSKDVEKRVPLPLFDKVMAGIHSASWEVETLPSPLGMYMQALEHADEETKTRAVSALQPIVGMVMSGDGEGGQQEVAMTADDLVEGWVVLPRMTAQALFKTTSSLELSENPNCEVALAMGEGGLEAVVVALKDIAAGESLTVAASGGGGDDDDDDGDDDDDEEVLGRGEE